MQVNKVSLRSESGRPFQETEGEVGGMRPSSIQLPYTNALCTAIIFFIPVTNDAFVHVWSSDFPMMSFVWKAHNMTDVVMLTSGVIVPMM